MGIFSSILNMIAQALKWVVALLPDSPFLAVDNTPISQFLGYINWFVPVGAIISTLEAWLVAVALYFIYSAILRWVKAIR